MAFSKIHTHSSLKPEKHTGNCFDFFYLLGIHKGTENWQTLTLTIVHMDIQTDRQNLKFAMNSFGQDVGYHGQITFN